MNLLRMRESIAERGIDGSSPGDIDRATRRAAIAALNREHAKQARDGDRERALANTIHIVEGPPETRRMVLAAHALAEEYRRGREVIAQVEAGLWFGYRALVTHPDDIEELAETAPRNSAILVAPEPAGIGTDDERANISATQAMLKATDRGIAWIMVLENAEDTAARGKLRRLYRSASRPLIRHACLPTDNEWETGERITTARWQGHHKPNVTVEHRRHSTDRMLRTAALMDWAATKL